MIPCPRCDAKKWQVGLTDQWRTCFYCGYTISTAELINKEAEQKMQSPQQPKGEQEK